MYLDYSVSSGPFLRFSMRFEFLSEMFDHSVCESRDPSLTIDVFLCGNTDITFVIFVTSASCMCGHRGELSYP